jgi:hypothetical protein
MPFALDAQATGSELSEAINYLLANLSEGLSVNDQTGQITAPNGNVVAYVYKYLAVKYADSFDGSLNFSNTPTNREYYGLRNTDSSVESTNPADYVWYKVSGGFGTTKFLFYLTTGGRGIEFYVGTAAPSQFYVQDNGSSIDLDFVTGATTSPSNFAVLRIANDFSPPTDAEVLSSIGRLPINGDLCIVNYNTGAASIQYRYYSGWTIFQKILTGDLVVANSITGTNIAANTVTASNMVAGTITAASGIIADAAITTAKIDDLQVSTIKIANFAVSNYFYLQYSSTGSGSYSDLSIGTLPANSSIICIVQAQYDVGTAASNWAWLSIGLNGFGSPTGGVGNPLSFFWPRVSSSTSVPVTGASMGLVGNIAIAGPSTSTPSSFLRFSQTAGSTFVGVNFNVVVIIFKK